MNLPLYVAVTPAHLRMNVSASFMIFIVTIVTVTVVWRSDASEMQFANSKARVENGRHVRKVVTPGKGELNVLDKCERFSLQGGYNRRNFKNEINSAWGFFRRNLTTLQNRRFQDIAILMFKVRRGLCPDYIMRLFSYNNTEYLRNL